MAKKIFVLLLIAATTVINFAVSCTTILVGKNATIDGSKLIARSEDSLAIQSIHLKYNSHLNKKKLLSSVCTEASKAHDKENPFSYFRENGFNQANIAISSTETIFTNKKVEKIDPYIKDHKIGVSEGNIGQFLLSHAHTAREAVLLLGHAIEKKGSYEGFGVAIADKDSLWYLENLSSHNWLARKIPNDKVFVSANQGRFNQYLFNNPNYLASKNLTNFVKQHKLGKITDKGIFNLRENFYRNGKNDFEYNTPRVWVLKHLFNKNSKVKLQDKMSIPTLDTPSHKLSIEDVKNALRNHFQRTDFDPFANNKYLHADKLKYRPISMFSTQQTHILQLRPNLPDAIGQVQYIAMGMSALSPYIPFYHGMTKIPHAYTLLPKYADNQSAYWKFRKVQTLAITNWQKYSPIVQKAYKKLEKDISKQQQVMEKEYLKIYINSPQKAQKLINDFEAKIINQALKVADNLTNQLFFKLTDKLDKKNQHFS